MASGSSIAPNLWQQAIDSLPSSVVQSLDPARTGKRDVALAALKVAEEKRLICIKKRWRIKTPLGTEDLIIRDVLEKIISWIKRFREVGDIIVQYDPQHAALPWAAVRFILQMAISDVEVHVSMVEGLAMVARLMAKFHELERIYVHQTTILHDQLCKAIVRVYSSILTFLANAVSYFGSSSSKRILNALFQSQGDDLQKEIIAGDAEVVEIATTIDADRLVDVHTQVLRLADLSLITQKAVDQEEFLSILKWLSQTPYSRHHEMQRETRIRGSGAWLLRHVDFVEWNSSSSGSILLLHGIPGCGKTALATMYIEKHLQDIANTPNIAPVAYFYCCASQSEPERNQAIGVLRSLARQLTVCSKPQPVIHDAVLKLYNDASAQAKVDGFELARAKLSDCVDVILATLDDNPAVLVIDALDELEDPRRLVDALESILSRTRNVAKVMITSRENPATLSMLPTCRRIRITKRLNEADVLSFAHHAVGVAISDRKLLSGSVTAELRAHLVSALAASAGEMFLWVQLQLLHLCTIEHERDLWAAATTPTLLTLEELYRDGFDRIQNSGNTARDIAIRCFTWLLYAKEDLKTSTFLDAIVIDDQGNHTSKENILHICRGFIFLDQHMDVFHLAHHSTREFLQRQNVLRPDYAHNLLARGCLSICTEQAFEDTTPFDPSTHLYDYAALYNCFHCSTARSSENVEVLLPKLTEFLFESNEEHTASLPAEIWMDKCKDIHAALPGNHSQHAIMSFINNDDHTPLFTICVAGFADILDRRAWPGNFNWNALNDQKHTALYGAAYFGHDEVVKSLLQHGADINMSGGRLGSPLHCAAYRGHVNVAKSLVRGGADPWTTGIFANTFDAARRGDQEDVISALIESDHIATQQQYDTVLQIICEAGFQIALQMLRKYHPDKHIEPAKVTSMASAAILKGNLASLRYLVRGSSILQIVPKGSLALCALHGHEKMAQYLLGEKLDVDEPGELGTPLRCASLNGHRRVCRLLLDNGASVNNTKGFGSALHAAAMKNQVATAQMLLHAGAKPNIKGGYYGTPLQAAAYRGHKEVARELLKAGADPMMPGISRDAFYAAAEGGHYEFVKFLIAEGNPLPTGRQSEIEGCALAKSSKKRCFPKNRFERKTSVEKTAGDEFSGQGTRYVNSVFAAAAADGDLDMICELLRTSSRRPRGWEVPKNAMKEGLIVAHSAGHVPIVDKILSVIDDDELADALYFAISDQKIDLQHLLLSKVRDKTTKATVVQQVLLLATREGKFFREALEISNAEITQAQIDRTLCKEISGIISDDRANILQGILSTCKFGSQEILEFFFISCTNEKAASVSTVLRMLDIESLSLKSLSHSFFLAIEQGLEDLTQELLPSFLAHGEVKHWQRAVFLSAGCGKLKLLRLLLESSELVSFPLSQSTLNIAAKCGHKDVCAYLIQRGLDPSIAVGEIDWACVRIKFEWYQIIQHLKYTTETNDYLSKVEAFMETDDKIAAVATGEVPQRASQAANGTSSGSQQFFDDQRPLNAVEACIAGYIYARRDRYRYAHQPEASLDGQEGIQMLGLLLADIPTLHASSWDECFCAAVEHCPPEIVHVMLGNGANPVATFGPHSTWEYAVRRKHSCYTVVQDLLAKRYGNVRPVETVRFLLDLTISQVHAVEFPSRYKDMERVGTEERKIEEEFQFFFTSGHGALIANLVEHTSTADLQGAQWSAFLECAAATGQSTLVARLVTLGIVVDSEGLYYGTPLQAACRFGHLDIIETMLEAGADTNIYRGKHHTALRAAIAGGHLEAVKLVLKTTPTIDIQTVQDVKSSHNVPILIEACRLGHILIVKALVEAGADINARVPLSRRGERFPSGGDDVLMTSGLYFQIDSRERVWTSMHAAIRKDRLDILQLILTSGFIFSNETKEATHPLVYAVWERRAAMVTFLLTSDVEIDNAVILHAAKIALRVADLTILKTLGEFHPSIYHDDRGISLLRLACQIGKKAVVEEVLEQVCRRGISDAIQSEILDGLSKCSKHVFKLLLEYSPFTSDFFVEACVRGDVETVRAGLAQHISANAIDSKHRPALHYAAINGHADIVDVLLSAGANPDDFVAEYGTPLMALLEFGSDRLQRAGVRPFVSQMPFEHNFDNQTDGHEARRSISFVDEGYNHDQVPNRKASRKPQRLDKVVHILLKAGATPNPPASTRGHVLTLAAYSGIESIYQTLLDRGADYAIGGTLYSPLVASIRGGQVTMSTRILKMRPSPSMGSREASLAMHASCENSNLPVLHLLLDGGVDCHIHDDLGRTPLRYCLANMPKNAERDFFSHIEDTAWAKFILVLLKADTRTVVHDEDVVKSSRLINGAARRLLLPKLLARSGAAYVPAQAFKNLISTMCIMAEANESLVHELLMEKRVQHITPVMIAECDNLAVFRAMLSYDSVDATRSDIVDAILERKYGREIVQKMSIVLELSTSYKPTISNVLNVLKREEYDYDGSYEDLFVPANGMGKQERLLHVMFSRNPGLVVDETMLMNTKSPEGLKFLLSRAESAPELLTDDLINAISQDWTTLLELLTALLDFDPSVVLPEDAAKRVIMVEGTELLGCGRLAEHDPTFADIECFADSADERYIHAPERLDTDAQKVVELLCEAASKYRFSALLGRAIRRCFPEHSLPDPGNVSACSDDPEACSDGEGGSLLSASWSSASTDLEA